MSIIKQLEISGIRSYKPGKTQKLQFYNPLTLIIGPNGSGKTTIVEALKYILTNEQPPNSKNGAFLYDLNLLNKSKTGLINKVESHVKIRFISLMNNKEYELIRRLMQTKTDSKVSIKTLETTLTCFEETSNTQESAKKQRLQFTGLKDDELQNKILSSGAKISDADKTILYHLNLSKALVDNVLLVHQNDSTWPLSDSLNIKKRMDAILDSDKYIKLIEDFKLERRRLNNQTKLLEQKYEFAKTLKNKAQVVLNGMESDKFLLKRKSLEHNGCLNKLNVYEISRSKYTNKLGDLEFKINLLKKSAEKLCKLKVEIETLNSKGIPTHLEINHSLSNNTIDELQVMINKEKENKEEMEKENKIYASKNEKLNFLKQEIQTIENEINKRVLEINEKEKDLASYVSLNFLNISLLNKDSLNSYLINLKESITRFMEDYHNSLLKIEKHETIKNRLKELEESKQALLNKRDLSKPEINYSLEIKCKETEIETHKNLITKAYETYSSPEFQFKLFFEEKYLKTFQTPNGTHNLLKFEASLKSELENLRKSISKKQRINKIVSALKNLLPQKTTKTELFQITQCEQKRASLFQKVEEVSRNQNLSHKIEKNDISARIYIKLKENGLQKNKCPLCNTCLENNEEFNAKLNKLISLLKENSDKLKGQVIEITGDYKLINESLKILKEEDEFLNEIEICELKDFKEEILNEEKELKEKDEIFENFKKYKKLDFNSLNLKELNVRMETLILERDALKNSLNEFESKNSTEGEVYLKRRLNEIHLEICNLKNDEEKFLDDERASKNDLLKSKEEVSKLYHHIKFNIKEVLKIIERKEDLEKDTLILKKSLKDLKLKSGNEIYLKNFEDVLNYKILKEKILEFNNFHAALKNIFLSLEDNFNEVENNEVALNLSKIITTLEEFPVSDFTDFPGSSVFDSRVYQKEEITDSSIFDSHIYQKEEIFGSQTHQKEEEVIFYEPEKMHELQNLLKINLHKLETMQENLEIFKNKLLKKIEEKNKMCHILEGEIKQLNNSIENKKNLFNSEYIYAEKNLNKTFLELKIHELYILDINDIITCSEKAMGDYHKEKIQEINESLRILWENTCDNDIENIEMKIEFNKTYNYKLVMHKKVEGDTKTVEMDMRGRCSAGQAMIASILFRLALCENFIKNPTIFALDEPTTNLDDDNVEALGNTFRILLNAFKTHQFVIITHDERFMSMIQTGDAFYKLNRKNGECIIQAANLL